jgi:hypothetical protein
VLAPFSSEVLLKLFAFAVAIAVLAGLLTSPLDGVLTFLVLIIVDRVLLLAESRGLINYRRNGLSRGAATYHTLELSSVFVPSMHEIIEAKYDVEERHADASGDPPVEGVAKS